MPASTCGHCKNAAFEIAVLAVGGSETRPVLQCAACGAVAGLLDNGDQTSQLKAQYDRIAALQTEVRALRSAFEHIAHQLERI